MNNPDKKSHSLPDPHPESVWNDPDYLEQLEQRADEDEAITSYENEKGLG